MRALGKVPTLPSGSGGPTLCPPCRLWPGRAARVLVSPDPPALEGQTAQAHLGQERPAECSGSLHGPGLWDGWSPVRAGAQEAPLSQPGGQRGGGRVEEAPCGGGGHSCLGQPHAGAQCPDTQCPLQGREGGRASIRPGQAWDRALGRPRGRKMTWSHCPLSPGGSAGARHSPRRALACTFRTGGLPPAPPWPAGRRGWPGGPGRGQHASRDGQSPRTQLLLLQVRAGEGGRTAAWPGTRGTPCPQHLLGRNLS